MPDMAQCPMCEGSGKCPGCEGEGEVSPEDAAAYEQMMAANGGDEEETPLEKPTGKRSPEAMRKFAEG